MSNVIAIGQQREKYDSTDIWELKLAMPLSGDRGRACENAREMKAGETRLY